MAEVWAARAQGPGGFFKPVAMKFILPMHSHEAGYTEMFFNEARLAAQLQHRNLVSITDFDRVAEDDPSGLAGHCYIVMERVDGRDLSTLLSTCSTKREPLSEVLATYIAAEILEGLRYTHALDPGTREPLIHRDISPQNVLISYSGEVKLSDFGIAKAASSRTTDDGMIRGKFSYFAPERLRGEKATAQTDQFAVGLILWEMLAGRMLFDGADLPQILDQVRACEIPSLAGLARPVSPALEGVVRTMLAPKAADRYADVGVALKALLQAVPLRAGMSLQLGELMYGLFPSPQRAPASKSVGKATEIVPELARAPLRDAPIPSPRAAGEDAPAAAPERPQHSVKATPATVVDQELARVPARTASPAAPNIAPVPDSGMPRTTVLPSPSNPPFQPTAILPADALPPQTGNARAVHRRGPAAIPKRFVTTEYAPGLDRAEHSSRMQAALAKHETEVAQGRFVGDFNDWLNAYAAQGIDAISGRGLPADWARVASWPRFAAVGWKRPLSFNWHGAIPWGDGGYWIAEDAWSDEMMVVFARDLRRDEFAEITEAQWLAWWGEREVDILKEQPGGSRLPISKAARELLGPGGTAPRTQREWTKIQDAQAEQDSLVGRAVRTDQGPMNATRVSLWQKMMGVAFGKKDPPR